MQAILSRKALNVRAMKLKRLRAGSGKPWQRAETTCACGWVTEAYGVSRLQISRLLGPPMQSPGGAGASGASDWQHSEALQAHGIGFIDVVIVNLYPFRQTVTASQQPSFEDAVEQIDIGERVIFSLLHLVFIQHTRPQSG